MVDRIYRYVPTSLGNLESAGVRGCEISMSPGSVRIAKPGVLQYVGTAMNLQLCAMASGQAVRHHAWNGAPSCFHHSDHSMPDQGTPRCHQAISCRMSLLHCSVKINSGLRTVSMYPPRFSRRTNDQKGHFVNPIRAFALYSAHRGVIQRRIICGAVLLIQYNTT